MTLRALRKFTRAPSTQDLDIDLTNGGLDEVLGTELQPGDEHYRAFVGPPGQYDLISAMVFNLLTCLGLRQQHTVLDIGAGSLRCGRLLIPYLNPGCYIGVEPNEWLVRDGLKNELGHDLVRIKQPRFSYRSDLQQFAEPLEIDFAVAQSIFSHTGVDLLDAWLGQTAGHLKASGVLLATFLLEDTDPSEDGWIYPHCVTFRQETVMEVAAAHGFEVRVLDWFHPRQNWVALARPDYEWDLVGDNGEVGWTSALAANG